ncbi:hypothetical protein CCACVL1_12942 [Corchorus capsularis]|uniref:Uncharacterized protein n=1 Tax=Corchorus capsularis TaxID=210143 RepID=A0A1R3ID10_COCAP|nr:hypothetical protein CCACVL1_12942 [Corchorus capsularis]
MAFGQFLKQIESFSNWKRGVYMSQAYHESS